MSDVDKYINDEYTDNSDNGCLYVLMAFIVVLTMFIGIVMNSDENQKQNLASQKELDAKHLEPLSSNVYDFTLLHVDVIVLSKSDKAFKLIKGDDLLQYIWVPISQLRADRNNNIWVSKWWTDKNWTRVQKKYFFKTYNG